MYERNAIVLERYFNQMFGYNMKNNIKTNFKDYCELVECLEKYKIVSDEEETIMQEYDSIANKIREIQKIQETLNKKNSRYQEERANIFQNIDESSEVIQKKLNSINNSIENINEEIKENAQQFVEVVADFSEKSVVRTTCGRKRRSIESEYNKKLNEILDNYKDIDVNLERKAKQFIETETDGIEKELKERIKKNGEKEKIPFNMDVITKAITLSVDIQKRETDILANIYEKTNKLFNEIKNNATKDDKHRKIIQDSKSKLEFLGAIKEYLIQFLDNERLTAVNGEEEHNNLMKEACKNLDEDLMQINNLYTLLLKEISKKITKKSYAELYNLEYLKALEIKSEEFDNKIKKLNLPVTVINPNYWRIEGMRKIYDVFYKCVTEIYGRDLSEYMPIEEAEEEIEDDIDDEEINLDEKFEEEKEEKIKKNTKLKNEEDDTKAEIDKKIDMILGFEEDNDDEEDDEWDYDDEDKETDEESWNDEDDWNEDEDWNDDFEEESEEDWDDDFDEDNEKSEDDLEDEVNNTSSYFWENDIEDSEEDDEEQDEEQDYDWEEENEDDDDDWEEEDEDSNTDLKSKIKKNNVEQTANDNWENEFVRIDKKENNKKKAGFFDKFKK